MPTEFATANGLSGDLLFTWRATELGPRINTTTTDAQRYLLGIEGQAAGWDVSAAAVYSANQQEVEYGGSYLYQSRIIPALRSGLINPWGPTGPQGRTLLASTVYNGTPQTADGSTSLINAYASKEIADLPAGPLAVALGGEARWERLSYDWDPALLTGDSPVGSLLKAISGSRDEQALFVEFGVSLARQLHVQLALRWDDYSDFGSTTNPMAALR
jgi:iron complex outermembrane receptor protein